MAFPPQHGPRPAPRDWQLSATQRELRRPGLRCFHLISAPRHVPSPKWHLTNGDFTGNFMRLRKWQLNWTLHSETLPKSPLTILALPPSSAPYGRFAFCTPSSFLILPRSLSQLQLHLRAFWSTTEPLRLDPQCHDQSNEDSTSSFIFFTEYFLPWPFTTILLALWKPQADSHPWTYPSGHKQYESTHALVFWSLSHLEHRRSFQALPEHCTCGRKQEERTSKHCRAERTWAGMALRWLYDPCLPVLVPQHNSLPLKIS